MSKKIYRVALLIETSREYGRGLLAGIAEYSRIHGPWAFQRMPLFYVTRMSAQKQLLLLKTWKPDGIIARDTEVTEKILSLGIPMIVASAGKKPQPGFPNIYTDNKALGRIAAEHLLNLGLKHFGYVGFNNLWWSNERARFFVERLSEAGFKAKLFEYPKKSREYLLKNEQRLLSVWLKNLEKPLGLLTCNDDCGQQVIEASKMAGIRVPNELAVLGIDNDQLICELSDIPLSSVGLATKKAGYDTAKLLAKMMGGKEKCAETIVVQPANVVARRSTEILAINDLEVLKVVEFIRDHSNSLIQIDDVISVTSLSRRTLQERFLKELGHSIGDEISRFRVEQIMRMLTETNMSILHIARSFGYYNADHIARYFRRATGMTLLAYRKQYSMR